MRLDLAQQIRDNIRVERQAEPEVESLRYRQEPGQVSEMPLADHPGRVAARFQQLGDRHLAWWQALRRVVAEDFRRRVRGDAVRAAADWQPAGHERGAAGRTHRLHVEVGPLLS